MNETRVTNNFLLVTPLRYSRFNSADASERKFGLSGIFQPLRMTSGGCKSAWCAIPRFYTPQDPKTSFGVQFRVFAHRQAGRMTAIGIRPEVRTERHFPAAQDNFRRMEC